jgi:hypothetical protein
MISARIAEIVLRDERVAIPIGSYNPAYGVTLSLPAIVGRRGVVRVLEPAMSADERQALQHSADTLRSTSVHFGGAVAEHQGPAGKCRPLWAGCPTHAKAPPAPDAPSGAGRPWCFDRLSRQPHSPATGWRPRFCRQHPIVQLVNESRSSGLIKAIQNQQFLLR